MARYDYDLFIVGAGSGGVRAARMAAGHGVRVAIAESRYLGGTCVNVGCVPKKLFVYGAQLGEEIERARGYGWQMGTLEFNWSTLLANKNAEIERLNGVYEKLLEKAGVKVLYGRAVLTDAHTVSIGEHCFRVERILIAAGGGPFVPDIPGKEYGITSNEVFFLPAFPKKVIIIGGGYIGVEFASIFHGLGAKTHLLHRGSLFLRGFDQEAREFLAEEMRKKGVQLHFNTAVKKIERVKGSYRAVLSDGGYLEGDLILFATGRRPNTRGIGLEALGVKLSAEGAIQVDENYCSSVPSIYAIGDVTHRLNLTPVAIAEAMALVDHLYGAGNRKVDYENIPSTVFSLPNLGTVGLAEEAARERYGAIDVYRSTFTPLKETLTGSQEKTLLKLIVEPNAGRVVGAHMVGSEAGEIIQAIAVALKAGATKATFDATLAIHPTVAEGFVTLREPVRR